MRLGLGVATTGWGLGVLLPRRSPWLVMIVPLARDDCYVYVGSLLASLHRAIWSEQIMFRGFRGWPGPRGAARHARASTGITFFFFFFFFIYISNI